MLIQRLLFLLMTLAALVVAAEDLQPRHGTFCWPMHYAGVVAGTSQDKHVVRLLGKGAYRPDESEGVRYYVDPRGSKTLKVSTFTDGIVGEISMQSGVASTLSKAERSRAVSKNLERGEGFGKWHALKLGSTESKSKITSVRLLK